MVNVRISASVCSEFFTALYFLKKIFVFVPHENLAGIDQKYHIQNYIL